MTVQSPATFTDIESPALGWAVQWLQDRKRSFIDGSFQGSGAKSFQVVNPCNAKTLGEFVETTAQELDLAVSSAQRAFRADAWKLMPRRRRAQVLRDIGAAIRRHQVELATLEALNNGKLYREAYNDDLPESADVFDYYAGWTDKLYGENCPVGDGFINYTVRQPVGVCALIVPWNFPLLLACWKIAAALSMANTVIVKPSPFTPLSVVRLFEILQEEVDLPPGVLNLVHGGTELGELISRHNQIDKISFTGSTPVGKAILAEAARSNLKLVSLELGGKSPNIVFADAPDLDFAIERSFQAMFSHKGEKCSEPTRLFLQEPIYEEFLARLAKMAEATICGDAFDPLATQGAQCHQAHFDKIMNYIEIGKSSKFRLIAGGARDSKGSNASGFFVRPTIFADVDNKSALAQEEIFGPVLTVAKFSTEDEVVAMANDSPYGLAAGLWTANMSRAHKVAAELEAGMVFINKYGCYDFASPFGGFKQSGWGKEMAIHSLDGFTKTKSVWLKV